MPKNLYKLNEEDPRVVEDNTPEEGEEKIVKLTT